MTSAMPKILCWPPTRRGKAAMISDLPCSPSPVAIVRGDVAACYEFRSLALEGGGGRCCRRPLRLPFVGFDWHAKLLSESGNWDEAASTTRRRVAGAIEEDVAPLAITAAIVEVVETGYGFDGRSFEWLGSVDRLSDLSDLENPSLSLMDDRRWIPPSLGRRLDLKKRDYVKHLVGFVLGGLDLSFMSSPAAMAVDLEADDGAPYWCSGCVLKMVYLQ
ncbi:hypothetical protein ACLOJK_027650 [Asimina triloba]